MDDVDYVQLSQRVWRHVVVLRGLTFGEEARDPDDCTPVASVDGAKIFARLRALLETHTNDVCARESTRALLSLVTCWADWAPTAQANVALAMVSFATMEQLYQHMRACEVGGAAREPRRFQPHTGIFPLSANGLISCGDIDQTQKLLGRIDRALEDNVLRRLWDALTARLSACPDGLVTTANTHLCLDGSMWRPWHGANPYRVQHATGTHASADGGVRANGHNTAQPPRVCIVVPARLSSSRLPHKVLLPLQGRPILQHVLERCRAVPGAERVYCVVDDAELIPLVQRCGALPLHNTALSRCGTDAICNVLHQIDPALRLIVNVQGDEPYVPSEDIQALIEAHARAKDPGVVCTTLVRRASAADVGDPSVGKAVLSASRRVLYCSRADIPATKSGTAADHSVMWAHLGVFVFERGLLQRWHELPTRTLQTSEDIEWLKIMEHDMHVQAVVTERYTDMGVNTPADYRRLVDKYGAE